MFSRDSDQTTGGKSKIWKKERKKEAQNASLGATYV